MKSLDAVLLLRYIFLTVYIMLTLYMMSMVYETTLVSFHFNEIYLVQFIGFTLIGCALHIVNPNFSIKNSWSLKITPVALVFVILYFIIAISLVARISFLVTIFLKLNITASLAVMPFQILFGYTFIMLFLKRD